MLRHAPLRDDAASMTPSMNRTTSPRVSIETYTVYDYIPHRFLIPFKLPEVYWQRRHPRTVVAWHALENEPSPLPILAVLALVFFAVYIFRQTSLVFSRKIKLRPLLAGFKKLANHEREREHGHEREREREREREEKIKIQSTQDRDKYRHVVEKLTKVVQKCRALQVQLKEQDDRLHRHRLALDTVTHDLEFHRSQNHELQSTNDTLSAANQQLKADNATLRERVYEQTRRAKDGERDNEALQRAIEMMEAEQAAIVTKCEDLVRQYQHENAELKTSQTTSAAAYSSRISELESQLEAARQENEVLRRRVEEDGRGQKMLAVELVEMEMVSRTQVEKVRGENLVLKQRLDEQESAEAVLKERLEGENMRLKQQLANQQTEHASQEAALREQLQGENAVLKQQLAEHQMEQAALQGRLQDENELLNQQLADEQTEQATLLERLSSASADQSEIRAKLERAQADSKPPPPPQHTHQRPPQRCATSSQKTSRSCTSRRSVCARCTRAGWRLRRRRLGG
ncbi:hypothetical protein BDW22DRAFT_1094986 [Trametopsis cervina]|nr:hypothetical protein BDW22DRAFT_1094986 [Trametopsis cervina]